VRKTLATAAALCVGLAVGHRPLNTALHAGIVAAAASDGLTEGARLAAIYDTILAARFEDARAALAAACPPAPPAACDALREVALWWEIQQNQGSRLLDARLEALAASAVASASRWTEREPGRAEAWFYLAGAHAPISQWRVLRGQRLTAARDGKRIKDSLERALALDPRLQDAWFGIGLYHYYADVAPAALKFVRFLLLLPGGDRVQGLQEMLRAREHGQLLRGEADYQLHWLYLWYERNPERALDLLRRLDARYPSNPLFLERIADVQHVHFSDHQASADSWKGLLDRATRSSLPVAPMAATRARVGLAAELIELSAPARAIELLDPIVRARPTEPYGVLALAYLTQGEAYEALRNRSAALDSFSRALDNVPRDDPEQLRARVRAAAARVRSQR
jgi:tetratricopeptide (TPR) repeat protein